MHRPNQDHGHTSGGSDVPPAPQAVVQAERASAGDAPAQRPTGEAPNVVDVKRASDVSVAAAEEPVPLPPTHDLVCRLCEHLVPAASLLEHTTTCLQTFPVRCACGAEDAALSKVRDECRRDRREPRCVTCSPFVPPVQILDDKHTCTTPACAIATGCAAQCVRDDRLLALIELTWPRCRPCRAVAASANRAASSAAAACSAQLTAVEAALQGAADAPSACIHRLRAIRKALKRKVKALNELVGAPRDVMAAAAGRVFNLSTLEFLKPISEGGAGQVYLARQRTTGDIFAVKIMSKTDLRNKNMVERVKNERRIMSATSEDRSNGFTVKLFASFRTREHVVLVMEYVAGGDMYSLLRGVGRLDVDTTRIFAAQLVLALEYLHGMGIAHRDLKPDNILITLRGSLKLTDFGLSHAGVTQHAVTAASRFGSHWWSRDKSSSSALAASLDMDSVNGGGEAAPGDVEVTEVDADVDADLVTLPQADTVITAVGDTIVTSTGEIAPETAGASRSSSGAASVNGASVPTLVPGAIVSGTSDSSGATNGHARPPPPPPTSARDGGGVAAPSRGLLDSSAASYMSVASDTQRRKLYSPVGTSNYLSPEVTLSIGHDERVDWWSLGVVIFEFLTGYPPFMDPHGNVDAVYENILDRRIQWSARVTIPDDARDIIEKLLTLRPNQRLGSRGAHDVKAHPFFAGIDWSTVMTASTRFVPAPVARDDTSYFEVPAICRSSQPYWQRLRKRCDWPQQRVWQRLLRTAPILGLAWWKRMALLHRARFLT